jgi:hypothetical protein
LVAYGELSAAPSQDLEDLPLESGGPPIDGGALPSYDELELDDLNFFATANPAPVVEEPPVQQVVRESRFNPTREQKAFLTGLFNRIGESIFQRYAYDGF